VVRSQTGDFTRAKGKEVMESFIKAEGGGKSICAVYAHNDDMMVGAIQAMKEAGLKPGKEILTVSIDAVPDIFKAMACRRSQRHRRADPEHGRPALDAIAAFKDKARSAQVDPDRLQALYRGRRSAEDLRQQEGPRLLRRGAVAGPLPVGPALPFRNRCANE
jgi:simple sugar transport system substrate-binding protein